MIATCKLNEIVIVMGRCYVTIVIVPLYYYGQQRFGCKFRIPLARHQHNRDDHQSVDTIDLSCTYHINYGHHAPHKLPAIWGSIQPEQVLDSKNYHTCRVQTEECESITLSAWRGRRALWITTTRYGLHNVRNNRYYENEKIY